MSEINFGYFIDLTHIVLTLKDLNHHQSSTTTVLAISFLTHLKSSSSQRSQKSHIFHTYLITSPCSSLALLLTRSTQFSNVGT